MSKRPTQADSSVLPPNDQIQRPAERVRWNASLGIRSVAHGLLKRREQPPRNGRLSIEFVDEALTAYLPIDIVALPADGRLAGRTGVGMEAEAVRRDVAASLLIGRELPPQRCDGLAASPAMLTERTAATWMNSLTRGTGAPESSTTTSTEVTGGREAGEYGCTGGPASTHCLSGPTRAGGISASMASSLPRRAIRARRAATSSSVRMRRSWSLRQRSSSCRSSGVSNANRLQSLTLKLSGPSRRE